MKYSILSLTLLIAIANESVLKFNFTDREFPVYTTPNLVSFLNVPVTPIFQNKVNRACIELCLGTLPQCFHLVIQSNSFYTWVVDSLSNQKAEKKFDPFQSMTFTRNNTEMSLKYRKKVVSAYSGKDNLTIHQEKLGRIFFAISKASDSFENYEGMIGLGYNPSYDEEKFSIIEQLYGQNIIYHKVFSQFFSSKDKGELTIGEIPKHIVDDYKKYGRCRALDKMILEKSFKNNKWQCSLTGIYYGDKYIGGQVKYLQHTKVSFFAYRRKALVPMEILKYFEESYFKKEIDQNKCRRTKLKKHDAIVCDENIIAGEEINLLFGEWSMKIPGSELFTLNEDSHAYEFIFYHKENYEKWILGRPILRLFNMVYDTQNQEVGFYSIDKVFYIANSPILPPKIHEKLSDKESKKKPDKNKNPHKKPPTLKPYTNNTDDITVPKENNPAMSTAYVIQMLLLMFVIIVAISFAGFGVWMYLRYRKKSVHLDQKYFIEKTQELSRQQ